MDAGRRSIYKVRLGATSTWRR